MPALTGPGQKSCSYPPSRKHLKGDVLFPASGPRSGAEKHQTLSVNSAEQTARTASPSGQEALSVYIAGSLCEQPRFLHEKLSPLLYKPSRRLFFIEKTEKTCKN
jgi:hypothetical protein